MTRQQMEEEIKDLHELLNMTDYQISKKYNLKEEDIPYFLLGYIKSSIEYILEN